MSRVTSGGFNNSLSSGRRNFGLNGNAELRTIFEAGEGVYNVDLAIILNSYGAGTTITAVTQPVPINLGSVAFTATSLTFTWISSGEAAFAYTVTGPNGVEVIDASIWFVNKPPELETIAGAL